ncbi:glutathione S-transferase family protein [Sphingomonas sp. C3-2]|uniref:glutathione S-transferase family protein n=1 Tax=Sphingomonas sp. C3-2 TaxID=3062169 RepID=UPI00294B16CA|nr:glutathione S-transferase family protein [Sphingomonas sp. C3-2]WOK36323.1 glutathione S-transferase family protein [Sphingomonas sp. C3-2]
MTKDLVFYTNPMSRGRIARWMLEETGAPYRTELVAYGEQMKSPGYLAVNPMGKVPAIRHGDTVVTECAAICAYLADAFPKAGLAPPSDDRGAYYRWLFFAAGPLEAAIMDRQLGVELPAEKQMMAGYGSYDMAVDTLEKAVDGWEYVTGDRFTAADVYVGSHVMWGTQFGTLPKRPAFEAYAARLAGRPAYQRASELDDEAGKAMPHPSAAG